MKILDLSAGRRAIWHNKKNPLCTYLDIRPEMDPDHVVDTTKIPKWVGEGFDLLVYDPPHMNCGPNSNMAKRYGHWTNEQIRESIRLTAIEAHRVAKDNALMALKWNNHDIKLQTVFELMASSWTPLFGHLVKNGPHSQTYWAMLLKNGGNNEEKYLEK